MTTKSRNRLVATVADLDDRTCCPIDAVSRFRFPKTAESKLEKKAEQLEIHSAGSANISRYLRFPDLETNMQDAGTIRMAAARYKVSRDKYE